MVLAKRLLGAIAILLGVAILGWFAYNLVAPTAAFRRSFGSVFQLILPIAMVWVGWRWLRDDGPGIETLQIDPKAPELLAATERARRTPLSIFVMKGKIQDRSYSASTTRKLGCLSSTSPNVTYRTVGFHLMNRSSCR